MEPDPGHIHDQIIELALEATDLSSCQLAVWFTDEQQKQEDLGGTGRPASAIRRLHWSRVQLHSRKG